MRRVINPLPQYVFVASLPVPLPLLMRESVNTCSYAKMYVSCMQKGMLVNCNIPILLHFLHLLTSVYMIGQSCVMEETV